MPYITREARTLLEPTLRPLCDEMAGKSDGTLNYALTSIVLAWLPSQPHYADYARAIAAFECAKLELYRTSVSLYEDMAKVQNGPL